MNVTSVALLGIALASAPLSACSNSASTSGGATAYGSGDPKLAASNLGGGPIDPFLSDGNAVLRALDAIAARSGKPLRITSINADRVNGLTVDVQEPAKHVNVDQYVVAPDGTLSGPAPVKLTAIGGDGPVTAAQVDAQAFDPKRIAFARLASTARTAIAKSGFDDARVTQWEFDGIGRDDRTYMYLEAARGRPVATLDAKLDIVKLQF